MVLKKNNIFLVLLSMSSTIYAASIVTYSDVKEHFEEAGGEGVDVVIMKKPNTLATQCASLSDVKVKYIQRRYGKVTVEAKSVKACKVGPCKLRLSWRHAPAGRLSYQVKGHWAKTDCT
jgi:hypothetical protein